MKPRILFRLSVFLPLAYYLGWINNTQTICANVLKLFFFSPKKCDISLKLIFITWSLVTDNPFLGNMICNLVESIMWFQRRVEALEALCSVTSQAHWVAASNYVCREHVTPNPVSILLIFLELCCCIVVVCILHYVYNVITSAFFWVLFSYP